MTEAFITNPVGILTVLTGVSALFFFLEKQTRWKLFNYFPPLLFIYAVPLILSNTKVIAGKSEVYGWMGDVILPLFLTVMLLDVDVRRAFKTMGKGIFVLLFGTLGVVIGAPIAYFLVKGGLEPETWKGFGALAGSWIGGTGNMAAVSEGLKTSGSDFGLAVLADNLVYIVWLPIMLGSKNLAKWFNKFTKVSEKRLKQMEVEAKALDMEKGKMEMRHILYLLFLGLLNAWVSSFLSGFLPKVPPVFTAGTWKILLVTTFGISLSFTPAKKIPGSHALAMALVYLFVANMGAKAEVGGLAQKAVWFVMGAFVWIFIHGFFCVLGAKIFRVDVHTTAIASAANIGGAASAPVVAAYHNEFLVPVSILMALIGYAIGNYCAFITAWLCYLVG